MKRTISLILSFILLFLLSACGNGTQSSDASAPIGKAPGFYELGIPSSESYTDFHINARNPWDMIVGGGKLYIGGGDYDFNTGPADIWVYDIKTEKWSNSGAVEDEQIGRFIRLGNKIIAPGIDPRYDPENGRCYVLGDGKWETFCEVPDAVHTFDIIEFNGKLFFGIGTDDYSKKTPIKVSSDGGKTFADVTVYYESVPVPEMEGCVCLRATDFFIANGELYCLLVANNGKYHEYRYFKYDGKNFQFHSKFGPNKSFANWQRSRIGEKVTFGDFCFLTTGYLYKTKNFTETTEVPSPYNPEPDRHTLISLETPDKGFVMDLLAEENQETGKTELYILSSTKDNKTTIWKYISDTEFQEIYSFDYSVMAMSFAKYENRFYIGMGGNNNQKDTVGTIVEIVLEK